MDNRDVLVLERNGGIGTETSARNSEVIHAGLYYNPNSLKAVLCVEGRRMLYQYCQDKDIPYKQCGKLIVATHSNQLGRLNALMEQAKMNGVDDIERLERTDVAILEPAIRCVGGCLSPSTGIIDSHRFMYTLQADAEASGATFVFNAEVMKGDVTSREKHLTVRNLDGSISTVTAANVINAAGLHAWEVAKSMSGYAQKYLPRGYFARGCYFSMRGRAPFTRLVYPIPELGGLGIHLTVDLQGKAKFGPDVEWIDTIDYTIDPSRVEHFYRVVRTYYPDLPNNCLIPDYAGIRPKNAGPDEPVGDFVIQTHQSHVVLGLIQLFGIESPGLTAALAIGAYVNELLTEGC